MSTTLRFASLALLASALVLPACGKKAADAGKQRKVTVNIGGTTAPNAVTANVAEFDPNADISLDLDKYGTEHPDEYAIQQGFFNAFEAMDKCVWDEKDRRGSEKQLPGEVTLAVKLNPEKPEPFAVNATMPEKLAKATKLKDCLREAAAQPLYPTYDGPPRVVEFEMEIDPGYVEE